MSLLLASTTTTYFTRLGFAANSVIAVNVLANDRKKYRLGKYTISELLSVQITGLKESLLVSNSCEVLESFIDQNNHPQVTNYIDLPYFYLGGGRKRVKVNVTDVCCVKDLLI